MTRTPALLSLICCVALAAAAPSVAMAADADPGERDALVERVDLEPLGRLAVYSDGRVKSYDSFARSMMSFVSGPRSLCE